MTIEAGTSPISTTIVESRTGSTQLASWQAHEGVRQLLLGGPEVGAAIDVMIKRASAHPRDAQAFQAVIRRYLQGEGGLASPVALATLGAPDAPSSACPT